MIDFDNIDDWAPKLTIALEQVVPKPIKREIGEVNFKYCEDALKMLFELTVKDTIIDNTLDWLSSTKIVFFHNKQSRWFSIENLTHSF